jgi:hypothetical protein
VCGAGGAGAAAAGSGGGPAEPVAGGRSQLEPARAHWSRWRAIGGRRSRSRPGGTNRRSRSRPAGANRRSRSRPAGSNRRAEPRPPDFVTLDAAGGASVTKTLMGTGFVTLGDREPPKVTLSDGPAPGRTPRAGKRAGPHHAPRARPGRPAPRPAGKTARSRTPSRRQHRALGVQHEYGSCTLRRSRFPNRDSCLWLRHGAPVAPGGYRLRLLPSGPDLVHGPPSLRDRAINTTNKVLIRGLHPSGGNSAPLERIAGTGHR